MTTYKTDLRYEINPEQQDAIWFYGDQWVGSVTGEKDGKSVKIDIYCDGETRFDIPYLNEDGSFDVDNFQVVRYINDWEAIGVTTDDQLNATMQAWFERGVEIHRFNSWFDLYVDVDGSSEHLDCVTHTISEAILQATACAGEALLHDSVAEWLNS